MKFLRVAAIFAATVACSLRASRPTPSVAICGPTQWTAPRSVVDSQWSGQFPSLAVSGANWATAADRMPRFDHFSSLPPVDIASGSAGYAIVGIRGGFFPRLGRGRGAGLYSLLWGQADTSERPFIWPPRVGEVYAATVTAEGARTGSRRIYAASEIAWDSRRSSALATDGSERLAVAFAAYKKDVGPVVVVLTRTSGIWHASETPTSSMASYVDVTFTGTSSLVVAFVAPAGGTAIDVNSVWTMNSNDGAHTWSKPTLIVRSGVNPASYARLAYFGGIVHLVWGKGAGDEMDPSVMVHSQSHDRGRTWTTPSETKIGHSFANLRAVATRCGLHVIGDEYAGVSRTGSLIYARWTDGVVDVTRPHPGWRIHDPDMAAMANGEIVVVAPGQPVGKATPGFFTVVTRGLMRSTDTTKPKEKT